ncbi:excinuclease ABC subunit C [Candidatus Roizmanbacteria bacterium RIFCSPHIGHO2_01_FULL_39_12b]|uniref:Excinuclease ABC subunit C n=1 Tax=Candidatus Roizmanbacteria bacterium RIFCSPHIGHO2_01_FULL_39_12b TaxID=1802030 RepID=A0A1F7GAI8_9BACT|nr:MAG: excinuclease ABC subunit C [Candidatus Roizmanbacteria bacterium RIFCSPHIGHO2_01_FULL_39_12b]
MEKQFCVYILTNKNDTTLYVGVTSNFQKRVWEHKNKVIEGFTKKYNLIKLVYYEIFDDAVSAISREKSLKNLVRRKKEALINKINPNWDDLYPKILSA